MFEGSNIHFSQDNKPLCSHSAKLCRQRRLHGYGFCVRHILEDRTAPFKQCAHINKARQQCSNAIPRNETRELCNNHLIILGLLPKKEKKTKVSTSTTPTTSTPSSAPNSIPTTPDLLSTFRPALHQHSPHNRLTQSPLRSPLPDHDTMPSTLAATLDQAKNLIHNNGIRQLQNVNNALSNTNTALAQKLLSRIPNVVNQHNQLLQQQQQQQNQLSQHGVNSHSPTVRKIVMNSHHDMDRRMSLPDTNSVKPRLRLEMNQAKMMDTDDPYAFPDEPNSPTVKRGSTTPVGSDMSPFGARSPMPSASPIRPVCSPSTQRTPVRSPLPGTPERNILSAVKLYPELAEKLSTDRPKQIKPQDLKNSLKSNALKSSRTMNALETRIAQNKIKDKMKRQENSLSGSDLQSPMSECSPTNSITNSSPKTMPACSPQSRNGLGLYSLESQYLGNGPLHVGLSAHTLMNAGRSPPLPSPPMPMTSRLPPPYPTVKEEVKPCTSKSDPDPSPGALYREASDRIKRLLRPKSVLTERQAKHRFKDKSAIEMYALYSRRIQYTRNLCKLDIDSSESDDSDPDTLPWLRTWFSPSSDEEEQESDDSDDGLAIQRTTRHALMKTRFRRRFLQMRRNHSANRQSQQYHDKVADTVVSTASRGPDLARQVLASMKMEEEAPKPRALLKESRTRPCLANKAGPCDRPALPFTNHCRKHIMYNVDQQLFDYCTGKNDDNTQCCDPVFNVKYDFPFCAKHALIALRQAAEVTQIKKRKKTKPSALTRPPKRGRKRRAHQNKNKSTVRPSSPDGADSHDDNDVPAESGVVDSGSSQPDLHNHLHHHVNVAGTSTSTSAAVATSSAVSQTSSTSTSYGADPPSPVPLNPVEKIAKDLAKIDRQLSTGARPFGNEPVPSYEPTIPSSFPADPSVHLEQAARLLEDHDINEVLNKLPDEAFDIFSGKNGDFVPTHEETEELERALAAVSDTVNRSTLDPIGFMDDATDDDDDMIAKQIADQILQQNLGVPDHLSNGAVDDHLQDLANSISDHDLKTMSQALSAYGNDSQLERGVIDLFGLRSESNGHSAPAAQPVEWTSAAGLANAAAHNGLNGAHIPQKLTQDLVGLLANQLMPGTQRAAPNVSTQSVANGETQQNALLYQLAVSLSQSQPNKQGTT